LGYRSEVTLTMYEKDYEELLRQDTLGLGEVV